MAEPVTIGGQTFIKTNDGWVDKKTKQPADKGLLRLLSSFETTAPSPKLRVKIDKTREPVTFSGTKYVYDLNQKGWIDQKSKILVPGNLQNILNNVSKPMAKPAAMGIVGQAGVSKVKEKPAAVSGSGVIPIRKNINTPIVAMVEKLATIDGYLKQRLDNQKKIAKGELQALREASIESQPDATPITQTSEGEEKKSNAGTLLAIAGVAAIIASQFEPVQEAFKTVVDGVKGIFGYVGDFVKIMADGLGALLGGDAAPSNSSPAVDATSVEKPTPTPSRPSVPGVQEVNTTTETPVATPSEPNEPNITAEGEKSQPDATPRASTLGRTLGGAAVGATFGSVFGVKGAAVGGAIGGGIAFFSGGSQRNAAPAMTTPSPDANGGPVTPVTPNAEMPSEPASGNIIQVSHPDTGSGWGIVGANDAYGRPVAFSKEGAVAFERMMRDSGGAVKPSDITSSKRSVAKNRSLKNAVPNSRHLTGTAMDIHGTSDRWIRQHGHRYGWKPHDYSGTHGGHFIFGGPGMAPGDAPSDALEGATGGILGGAVKSLSDMGAGVIKAIGEIIKTGMGDYDIRSLSGKSKAAEPIKEAAVQRNAAIAEERSAKDGPTALPAPVNINRNPEVATIENLPSGSDMAGPDFYLTRFGFPKIEYNQRAA